MPEETHKRSWVLEVGKQIASVVITLIIASFLLGGKRERVAQKVTTLETEMAVLKEERKAELKHITEMDLEGSVATKNFVANYEKKQASQDATVKEIQNEVRHLELMKAQIDRLERKVDDGKGKQ